MHVNLESPSTGFFETVTSCTIFHRFISLLSCNFIQRVFPRSLILEKCHCELAYECCLWIVICREIIIISGINLAKLSHFMPNYSYLLLDSVKYCVIFEQELNCDWANLIDLILWALIWWHLIETGTFVVPRLQCSSCVSLITWLWVICKVALYKCTLHYIFTLRWLDLPIWW